MSMVLPIRYRAAGGGARKIPGRELAGALLLLVGTAFLYASLPAMAQNNDYWRNGVGSDGNWNSAGVGHWWNGGALDSPDSSCYLHFDSNWIPLTTNNLGSYSAFQILIDSACTVSRTISGNTINFYDYGGRASAITNASSSTQTINCNLTVNNQPLVISPTGGDLVLNGSLSNNGNDLHIRGPNSKMLTLSGNVSGAGKLIVKEYSKVKLSGASSITGNIEIDTGEVWLDTGASVGAGSLYVGNGGMTTSDAKLWLNGAVTNANRNITVNTGDNHRWIGGLNTSGVNLFGGTLTLNAQTYLEANQAGGTIAFTNVISGSSGIVASGPGTLILGGNSSSWSGGIYVDTGTLQLNHASGAGTGPIRLGKNSAGTDNTTLYLSGAITVANTITNRSGNSGSTTIGSVDTANDNGFSGPIQLDKAATFTAASGHTVTISSNITGTGAITKSGSGTVALSGNNTYSGGTTVSAGTLKGNTASLQGNITDNATVEFNMTADGAYNGIISGSGGALLKSGSATLTMTGANSHDGATTVSAGTLIYNGTNTSSAVTVNAAGTLMGTGSIGALTLSGTNNPGNGAVGTLRVAGLTLNNGSVYRCEIGNCSSMASVDCITNTGSLTINATAKILLDSALASNWASNAPAYSWVILTNSTASVSVSNLALDTNSWTLGQGGGVFSLAASGNSLLLDFTPVPQSVTATKGTYTTKVTIQWADAVGETGYKVYRNTSNSHSGETQIGGTLAANTVTFDDTTAVSGTTYYYWVTAVTPAGETGYSVVDSGYSTSVSPPTVDTPTVSAITVSGATLGATISATNGAPILRRGTVWGTSASPTGNGQDEGGTSAGVFTQARSGMSAGTYYYYRGYASNSAGMGYSSDGTFYTLCSPPSLAAASAVGMTSFYANWSAATGATNYFLDVATDSGFTSLVSGYSNLGIGNVTTYQVSSGLSAGTTYYYRLRAQNQSGTSANPGSGQSATTEPTQPSGLAFSPVSSNSLSVTWSGNGNGTAQMVIMKQGSAVDVFPSDATSYTANSSFGAGGALGGGNYIVYSGSGSPAAVSGLTPNTTYYVAVIGFNGAGATANYNTNAPLTGSQLTLDNVPIISATPLSMTVTAMVGAASIPSQNLYVTNSGGSRLCYTVASSATSWLNVSPTAATNAQNAGTTHTVSFTATGLSACTSNGTLTVTSVGTGTNAAVQTTTNISVSMTLTNIPSPTSVSASASGKELVSLGWTSSYQVMIVYQAGSDPATAPNQGSSYTVGQTIGGGIVIFNASGASSFAHMLPSGTDAHYTLYAVNGGNYYSAGVSPTHVQLSSYGSNPTEIVDPFNYTNGATLAGLNGGGGFAAGWSESSTGAFTVSSGSFGTDAAYPTPAGNKITANSGGTAYLAYRTLSQTITNGSVYVGFYVNCADASSGKYAGLSLMDGATEKFFFGKVGSAGSRLGIGVNGGSDVVSGYGLNGGSGSDYIVIGRYVFSNSALSVKAYWAGSSPIAVDAAEPGSWDTSTNLAASIAQVTGIRLAAGFSGATYFDEVRVARSWAGLLNELATRPISSPTAVNFTSVTGTGMTINWTTGNGTSNLVVLSTNATLSADPYEGTSYTANSAFGSGQALGGGYVVFKGTNTTSSVAVTGLAQSHTYYASVYAFNGNGGTENYLTNAPATGYTNTTMMPPAIAVNPTSLSLSAYRGSLPTVQSFYVTNAGGMQLDYTNALAYAAGATGWLVLSPTNQGLTTGAWWTNSVTVIASNLAPATYYATNTLTGNQTNGTPTVVIAFTVNNLPAPSGVNATAVSPRQLTVNWTAAGYDVMVVRRQGAVPEDPAQGTAYALNATYGSGNQVIYAHGAGTSVTDSGVLPQTPYYYACYSENHSFYSTGTPLSVTTPAALIDGVADEWVGIAPTVVNSSTISSNEFIWRDKVGEQRNDSTHPGDVDITEFRVRADTTNLYFYVHFQDITDVKYPYLAIGVDTDQSPTDSGMNWLGDDTGILLGGGYAPDGNAKTHYSEHNIIVHTINGVGQRVELYADNGSAWYAPSSSAVNFNTTGNFMEFSIPRADLGLSGTATGRFTVASCLNTEPGDWANSIDTTVDFSTCDALDSLSITPFGVPDNAGNMNAWDEELSDGDIDFFFDVRLDAGSVAANQPPNDPPSLFPTNNAVMEQGSFTFSWGAATDPDGTVGSYLLEVSTNSSFGGGENMAILYRENLSVSNRYFLMPSPGATQYYWRVRSRDMSGALSAGNIMSFQIGPPDDDTQGPTPSLVYIGPSYTAGLTQTNITDADLANTNNLVDIAVQWTDPSGVFLTNHTPYANNNIYEGNGRVIPNWDLYTTNVVTHAIQSFGYDQPFADFYGHNGDTVVTTVYHNAFSISNIDTNNIFYLTVSAEDEDNDRGTYPDPQGDGDPVPWDRAITINALVRFYVTDDDTVGPVFSGFNIDGADFINTSLGNGLTVTGQVQDVGSGVAGNTSTYVLYRNGSQVASGSFTTQPMVDGVAQTSSAPVGVTIPLSVVGYTGTYHFVASAWDADNDKTNDRALGTNEFVFTVSPPPAFNSRMAVTLGYNRAEALTNFSALVVLSPSLPGFSYSQFASPHGYDLRFSDGAEEHWLNYEIEQWDTNGNSYVWVQIPVLSAASNSLWACWGSAAATNPPASTTNGSTWASEYRGVFHLQAVGGTMATDATAYARNGTLVGPVGGNWASGQIGGGLTLSGLGDYVSNSLASSWSGPFTVSFWAKAGVTGQAAGAGLFDSGSAGFQIQTDGSTPGNYQYAGGAVVPAGPVSNAWVMVTITCDGSTTRTYTNGVAAGSATDARTAFSHFDIGINTNRNSAFTGQIDELEIAATARSSNWVWAVWQNQVQNGNSLTYGIPAHKGTFFQIDADSTVSGVALPYAESFETLPLGPLGGLSNWNADASVTVQGSVVYGGSRAARLANGTVWHGLQPASGTNVWLDWYARPVWCDIPPLEVADVNWNATAAFYINGNGHVVSRGNGLWATNNTVTLASNAWSRFSLHLDYVNHLWSLYVADSTPNATETNVASNLPFHATNVNALVSFRMSEEAPSAASYLDNLAAASVAPLAVDDDHNGLPDTWERAYFSSNGVPPDVDSDHDGIDNRHEYLAGTNPMDSNSFLRIIGLDLPSAASADLTLSIRGGGYNGGSPYTNTGDHLSRSFVVQRVLDDATAPKVTVATVSDSGTGTNTWTDTGATGGEGSRYYSLAVTLGGSGYTNTEEWAVHTQARQAGNQYLVTVPVDYGSTAANNLNSTLGQQMARGLYAGTTPSNADKLRRWDASGTWQEYYLFTNPVTGGSYWSADLGGATTANVTVAAGTAFWVVRGAGAAARGNTVFAGRSFTSSSVADTTFTTSHGGWTMFGWTLPQPGRHRNLGAATPANQLGFSTLGTGGRDPVSYPGYEGDRIYVWESNTWKHWYWLVGNTGASYDGRWWDNNYSGTSTWHFADFSLEVGKAYYYWHPGNNGATNFVWHPAVP